MNLEDIDKIFNDNQHQFDKMPSDKLWERLEDKLDATPSMWEEKPQTKVKWLRYVAAAAVILLMAVPAMYLIDAPMESKHTAVNHSTEMDAVSGSEREIARSLEKLEDTGSMVEASEKSIYLSDEIIEEEGEEENTEMDLIAKADAEKKPRPSTATAKKDAKSNSYTLPKNKARNIAKPKAIPHNPKPTIVDRDFETTETTTSSPSPISEEPEMEESYVGTIYMEDEAVVDADEIIAAPPINNRSFSGKVAGVQTIKADFDISNTEGVYADSRYNAYFIASNFSNALPYDEGLHSQSTLEKFESKDKPVKSARKRKKMEKSKEDVNNNVLLKRSASKEAAKMPPPPPPISLGFLNSLEGNWVYYSGNLRFEENWLKTPNGTLLGTANTRENGQTLFSENLSITSTANNQMVYTINHPQNPQSLTFNLTTSADSENHLVFENLQNDFPNKITYRLATETMLEITFEGKKDGKPHTRQLVMTKE